MKYDDLMNMRIGMNGRTNLPENRKLERRNRTFAAVTFAIRPKPTLYILALWRVVKNHDASSKKNEPKGAIYPPKLSTYPRVSTSPFVDSMKADYSFSREKSENVKKMQFGETSAASQKKSGVKLSTFVDNIGGQLVTGVEIKRIRPDKKTA